MENPLLGRITIDDQICNGKPIIRGYRITVKTIIEFLLAGSSTAEVLKAYPLLEEADIEACKLFAVLMVSNQYDIKSFAA
jgi:uncharacterized protein (DUF433 family)